MKESTIVQQRLQRWITTIHRGLLAESLELLAADTAVIPGGMDQELTNFTNLARSSKFM